MLLDHDDFREVFGEGGDRFERLLHDLVRTETRRLGIPENDVHWDQRTNVADGGCDIWVSTGHADTSSFLPLTPTSISLKSGEDGTKSATFASEVRDHPTLIARLKAGNSFLWCCPRPISQEKRKELVSKAKELSDELKCDVKLFSFFWIDAISERIERSPHLIAEHLPTVWRRLEGLSLVKNWQPDDREPVRKVTTWVDFDGRNSVKQIIKQHLCGTAKERLLHVAGLSGSGKTRTVVQACKDERALENVIYCPALSQAVDRLLTHLSAKSGTALLIIDEVPLDEYEFLARRIEKLPETVRVVSMGPGRANERQREGILILAPPTSVDNVAAVAHAAAGVLGDDVIQNIAMFAGKDLRLALLLVEATLKTQAPQFVPLRDNRDVWRRIRALFAPHITCPNFDHHYGLLTTTIDIGVHGTSRQELDYLAKHFGEPIGTMEACVRDAVKSGLGSKPFDHFEATPRALAQWIFLDQAWPALQHRVDQFLANCPSDRLRRKFLERCQELPERDRQEVMEVVRDFFLKHFGEPNLSRLSEGNESKLFQAWAETDPEIGLEWLGRATRFSHPADFVTFNGESNYSGGWNGRRQVVWLCEHLSCFREYFSQTERILFDLSHVETEKSIGNNGTNIWKSLFHPSMSYTEVPFDDRLAVVMRRLREAEGRSLELVVAAIVAMLGDGGMRVIPPSVVGGRVRPTGWKPATREELLGCMIRGGNEFFKEAASLAKARQLFVLEAIMPDIGRFFDLGLFDEFRRWVTGVDPGEGIARKLRKELDSWLSWRRAHMAGKEKLIALVDCVQQWRDSLEPRSLIDRAEDLTSRSYWEHVRELNREGKEVTHEEAARETDALYRSIAKELLKDIGTFAVLGEWLGSSNSKSGDALAQAIASLDREGTTHAIVGEWIAAGTALPTCAGYLRGLGDERRRAAPVDAAIERLVDRQPGAAIGLIANGDFSEVGFERIIRCLKVCKAEELKGLGPLVSYSWRDFLTEGRVLVLASELHRLQQVEGYHAVASSVAIDILHLVYSQKAIRDPTLAAVVLHILVNASDVSRRNGWEWVQLAKAVHSHDPKTICRLAINQLVESQSGFDDALNVFVAECARSEPDEAMAVLGELFTEKKKRWIFRALVFRDLFDSIGVTVVSRYLGSHPDQAALIARHLAGPSLGEGGNLQVPELADWIMGRFGENPEVWNEFMMGRHSFEVFGVPEGYEAARDVATRFATHPTAWVRRWAEAEIADMEKEIQAHRREEDHHDRQ